MLTGLWRTPVLRAQALAMLVEGTPTALATAGIFSVATERKVFASRELSELGGEDAGCSCIHVPTTVHGQEVRPGRAEQRQERDLLCSGPVALSPILPGHPSWVNK